MSVYVLLVSPIATPRGDFDDYRQSPLMFANVHQRPPCLLNVVMFVFFRGEHFARPLPTSFAMVVPQGVKRDV